MISRTIKLLAPIAFTISTLTACDSGSSQSAHRKANDVDGIAAEAKQRNASLKYSLDATRNDWPPLEGAEAALAEDIVAANYYIVLDGSGSMKDSACSGSLSKMNAAKHALREFTSKIPENANVGLFSFDANGIGQRVALGTRNRDQLTYAIDQTRAGSATPLRTSLSMGYRALEEQAKIQLGYGEYNLVVVTDGRASPEREDPSKVVAGILASSPIVVHTIGFCINDRHSLNQPGATYYRAANDTKSLQAGLDDVLAEAPKFDVDNFSQN